jgi:hypothetical protein
VLPFTESNNLKTKHLHLWMRGRRIIEQQREGTMRINSPVGDCTKVVDCPALSDVVFKPGSSSICHPGNAVFHEMLRNYFDDSQLSQDSVGMIYNGVTRRNGNFLEWDSCGYWKVISDPFVVRQKIYNAFIHAKKSFNAKKRTQNSLSSTFLFERQDGKKRKRSADGREVFPCVECCRF